MENNTATLNGGHLPLNVNPLAVSVEVPLHEQPLLASNSTELCLTRPTTLELLNVWHFNSESWNGGLSLQEYVDREKYLMNAPLARDGGITHWILVNRNLSPDKRAILASCESIEKHTLVAKDGKVVDAVSHGIGSVFCPPECRGRGYASRMMADLAFELRIKHPADRPSAFSALWSDIGKSFYANLGWHPYPSMHFAFSPLDGENSALAPAQRGADAHAIGFPDLEALCKIDEKLIRKNLEKASHDKIHVAVLPSHSQMLWHLCRENFLCKVRGRKEPEVVGAIIGEPGHRMWMIFARTINGAKETHPIAKNHLYILRLVIEDEHTGDWSENLARNSTQMRALVAFAQNEASKWNQTTVQLWNPSENVQEIMKRAGLTYAEVQRTSSSIPSLMWYGENSGKTAEIEWVGNERYAWC